MRRISVFVLAATIVSALSTSLSAQEQRRVQVGSLSCNVAPSVGLIIGSQQRLSCIFKSRTTGRTESYTGVINRLGLDIGFTGGGKLVWGVYAPNTGLAPHSLAGSYVGGSGEISLVAGVGANALVGGSNRSIALQPLSVKGQVGANLALGIAGMTLQ